MRLIAVVAIAALGCESAPSNPTWTADVKPILQANCIKCHGKVPRGGAPLDFRLDTYFGATNADGQALYGAALVALFIHERTHAETMPPVAPLSGVQIDTLENWFDNGAEFGEPVASNAPPEMTLLDQTLDDQGFVVIEYQISDPDFDVVSGALEARGPSTVQIPGELYSGRDTVVFDAGAAAEGTYELVAILNDGNEMFGGVEAVIGTVDVSHAGNTAPAVTIRSPRPDSLFPVPARLGEVQAGADCGNGALDSGEGCDDSNMVPGDGCDEACRIEDDGPCNIDEAGSTDDASCSSGFCDTSGGDPGVCTDASRRIIFTVEDPDADSLDVTVTAVRAAGAEPIEIATLADIGRGKQSVTFDPQASLAGGPWTIRVEVTDGQASRSATVRPIVITSGPQPTSTFDDIQAILSAHCSGCHVSNPNEVGFADGTSFVYADIDNVRRTFGGEVYRRVVLDLTMPARSTEILNGRELMPQSDRALVGEWLLGGAPQ